MALPIPYAGAEPWAVSQKASTLFDGSTKPYKHTHVQDLLRLAHSMSSPLLVTTGSSDIAMESMECVTAGWEIYYSKIQNALRS